MNKKKLVQWVVVMTAIGMSHGVIASEIDWHGYISQSLILSTDNPFYDDEPGNHWEYREAGLGASWNPTERVRLAGLILSRTAGSLSHSEPQMDFLLLDYNFYVSEDQSAGVRLGRVKNQYGFYNATRDVPHVRPGVFVPQSVYFESFRDALLAVDGGNFYWSGNTPLGDLTADLYGGVGHADDQGFERQIFQNDAPGKFEDIDQLGLKVSWIPSFLPDLTLAYTFLDISMDFEDTPTFTSEEKLRAIPELINNPGSYSNYITRLRVEADLMLYSAQYTWDSLVFTAEYLDIKTLLTDFEVLDVQAPDRKGETLGYYGQVEWIASDRISVYARHEQLYYSKNDKGGRSYARRTGGNPATHFSKSWTVGSRWYFTPNLALTGEFSLNQGAAFINGQEGIEPQDLEKNWDMVILQLSYHF